MDMNDGFHQLQDKRTFTFGANGMDAWARVAGGGRRKKSIACNITCALYISIVNLIFNKSTCTCDLNAVFRT